MQLMPFQHYYVIFLCLSTGEVSQAINNLHNLYFQIVAPMVTYLESDRKRDQEDDKGKPRALSFQPSPATAPPPSTD